MKNIFTVALVLAARSGVFAEPITPAVALVDVSEEDAELIQEGVITTEDIIMNEEESTSDVVLLPEPIAETAEEAVQLPGEWTDNQKLTLETFKEIVATDIENIWVVAYIDPRCRDCLVLSLEWEKLTQIEEREKRKIKLGYVDISVEENWKIIQDHTKGKKMTHTPAVTLYGTDDKKRPHWYEKEAKPSAEGVHKWATSYADYYGYGWWNPEDYEGAGVKAKDDGYNRHGYGIGARNAYDSKNHDGALAKAGVRAGQAGKGYITNGKWQKGDQELQLKVGDGENVMRRRTVTMGGQLSGAAHDAPNSMTIGARPTYQERAAWGHRRSGWSKQVPTYNGYQTQGYGRLYGQQRVYGQVGYSYGYGQSYARPYKGWYTDKNRYQQAYGAHYGAHDPYWYTRKGTYGNPYVNYRGPGYQHLQGWSKYNHARYDPVLGKGIVLGKYSRTLGGTKKATDFDEKEIAGPDSQMYKDALSLALKSGKGESDITAKMEEHGAALRAVDNIDMSEFDKIDTIQVQEAPEVPTVPAVDAMSQVFSDTQPANLPIKKISWGARSAMGW